LHAVHLDIGITFVQVRSVMERQAEMERALMQQHETLRHENGMLWQHIEISRRNQDALNSKLSQVISTFQHIANRFSTSRPSKIVAPNGQQLIELQDHAVEAEEEPTNPFKRTRYADLLTFGILVSYVSKLFMFCKLEYFSRFNTILLIIREEVEDASTSSAATVLGQISQILRDGLIDASG
jgi:hypothetical protein